MACLPNVCVIVIRAEMTCLPGVFLLQQHGISFMFSIAVSMSFFIGWSTSDEDSAHGNNT